jgi:hypothetical protein
MRTIALPAIDTAAAPTTPMPTRRVRLVSRALASMSEIWLFSMASSSAPWPSATSMPAPQRSI